MSRTISGSCRTAPGARQHALCRGAEPGGVLPDAGNEVAARHVRRQDDDRRLPGTHRVRHDGGTASYAGGIINIDALREYRARSLWGNWLKDLRTEQFRLIYEHTIYEPNRALKEPPLKHAENDVVVRAAIQRLHDLGIWVPPADAGD